MIGWLAGGIWVHMRRGELISRAAGGKTRLAAVGTALRVPENGLLKRGLYWRIARYKTRRFLLRSEIVMAAAGPDPPWPPL